MTHFRHFRARRQEHVALLSAWQMKEKLVLHLSLLKENNDAAGIIFCYFLFCSFIQKETDSISKLDINLSC